MAQREPEPVEVPAELADYLAPAVEWVRERGGCAPCARDMLKVSLSLEPKALRAALKKAGAPVGVFGLLSDALYREGMGLWKQK